MHIDMDDRIRGLILSYHELNSDRITELNEQPSALDFYAVRSQKSTFFHSWSLFRLACGQEMGRILPTERHGRKSCESSDYSTRVSTTKQRLH